MANAPGGVVQTSSGPVSTGNVSGYIASNPGTFQIQGGGNSNQTPVPQDQSRQGQANQGISNGGFQVTPQSVEQNPFLNQLGPNQLGAAQAASPTYAFQSIQTGANRGYTPTVESSQANQNPLSFLNFGNANAVSTPQLISPGSNIVPTPVSYGPTATANQLLSEATFNGQPLLTQTSDKNGRAIMNPNGGYTLNLTNFGDVNTQKGIVSAAVADVQAQANKAGFGVSIASSGNSIIISPTSNSASSKQLGIPASLSAPAPSSSPAASGVFSVNGVPQQSKNIAPQFNIVNRSAASPSPLVSNLSAKQQEVNYQNVLSSKGISSDLTTQSSINGNGVIYTVVPTGISNPSLFFANNPQVQGVESAASKAGFIASPYLSTNKTSGTQSIGFNVIRDTQNVPLTPYESSNQLIAGVQNKLGGIASNALILSLPPYLSSNADKQNAISNIAQGRYSPNFAADIIGDVLVSPVTSTASLGAASVNSLTANRQPITFTSAQGYANYESSANNKGQIQQAYGNLLQQGQAQAKEQIGLATLQVGAFEVGGSLLGAANVVNLPSSSLLASNTEEGVAAQKVLQSRIEGLGGSFTNQVSTAESQASNGIFPDITTRTGNLILTPENSNRLSVTGSKIGPSVNIPYSETITSVGKNNIEFQAPTSVATPHGILPDIVGGVSGTYSREVTFNLGGGPENFPFGKQTFSDIINRDFYVGKGTSKGIGELNPINYPAYAVDENGITNLRVQTLGATPEVRSIPITETGAKGSIISNAPYERTYTFESGGAIGNARVGQELYYTFNKNSGLFQISQSVGVVGFKEDVSNPGFLNLLQGASTYSPERAFGLSEGLSGIEKTGEYSNAFEPVNSRTLSISFATMPNAGRYVIGDEGSSPFIEINRLHPNPSSTLSHEFAHDLFQSLPTQTQTYIKSISVGEYNAGTRLPTSYGNIAPTSENDIYENELLAHVIQGKVIPKTPEFSFAAQNIKDLYYEAPNLNQLNLVSSNAPITQAGTRIFGLVRGENGNIIGTTDTFIRGEGYQPLPFDIINENKGNLISGKRVLTPPYPQSAGTTLPQEASAFVKPSKSSSAFGVPEGFRNFDFTGEGGQVQVSKPSGLSSLTGSGVYDVPISLSDIQNEVPKQTISPPALIYNGAMGGSVNVGAYRNQNPFSIPKQVNQYEQFNPSQTNQKQGIAIGILQGQPSVNDQTQLSNPSQTNSEFSPLITSQQQPQYQPQGQNVGQITITPTPPDYYYNIGGSILPPFTGGGNIGFGGGGSPPSGSGGVNFFNPQLGKKPKGKYHPSFIAVELGIKSSKKEGRAAERTGIDVRGIISGGKKESKGKSIGFGQGLFKSQRK